MQKLDFSQEYIACQVKNYIIRRNLKVVPAQFRI